MTDQTTGKGAALQQIEDQWQQFLDSVNALPQEDLPQLGAVGP